MIYLEELKKIADLSVLALSEQELQSMVEDMNSIVAFAHQVAEVPVDQEDGTRQEAHFNYRPDEVTESMPQKVVLQPSANDHGGYFTTLKRG